MIRRICTLDRPIPAPDHSTLKNILEYALTRSGVPYRPFGPARWGWGAYTIPDPACPHRFLLVGLGWGSADPRYMTILDHLTPESVQQSAVETGIDWPDSVMQDDAPLISTDILLVQPVTPIRVLESVLHGRRKAILILNAAWTAALNRTMSYRFGRPFHLQVQQDQMLAHHAVMGIRPLSAQTNLPGIVAPFILTAPETQELQSVWASGLGANTGMGFGWVHDALNPSRFPFVLFESTDSQRG